jgi:hypothetical protein
MIPRRQWHQQCPFTRVEFLSFATPSIKPSNLRILSSGVSLRLSQCECEIYPKLSSAQRTLNQRADEENDLRYWTRIVQSV